MKTTTRALAVLLSALMLLSCTTGLVSCGIDSECEHQWGEWSVKSNATCISAGVEERACAECGDTEIKPISALGHDWSDATCTAPKTCKTCSATEGSAAAHAYTVETVKDEALKSAATCTSAAVYYKSCAVCGDISKSDADTFTSGNALGHKDENKDHVCENGCSDSVGTCEDVNKDHACDYGCSNTLGTCEDANKDHACDYGCAKVFGEHADSATDKDHVCDYGCGVAMENCKDAEADGDHACDVCAAADVSAHKYGDATCGTPATCSDCGATTGSTLEHTDANHDHVCDGGCGKTDMGEHADSATDSDHLCDYGCKAVLENCVESKTDADHNCDICGKANVSAHEYTVTASTDATCTAAATKTYTCNCGDSYKETEGDALGHNITGAEAIERKVSGCEYVMIYICQAHGCGAEVEGETVYKHNYIASIEKPATCKEDGLKTFKCACGAEKDSAVIPADPTGHKWTVGQVVNGTRTDTCSVCSETKTVTVYEGNKTDEISAGELADKEIELNDANISLDSGVIDAIGDQKVTVSADKLEGDDRTDLGLSKDQMEQVGKNPIYNFTINNGSENISDFNNNFVTITLPYELKEGEDVDSIAIWFISDKCADESCTDGDACKDVAHRLVSMIATYNNGYVTFKTNHFSYYTVTRLTPAERCELYGHGYAAQKVEGNCTKDSYDLYVCIRCHDKYIDETTRIVADGHDHVAVTTPATCTADGKVVYTCKDCRHSYQTKLPATGHKMETVASAPATCTADGYVNKKCANCDETTVEVIAKLAHSYTDTVVSATCTADGYTKHVCTGCGYTYTDNYVTAKGHTYAPTAWTWAADNGSAVLTFTCAEDATHTVSLNATVAKTTENGTCSTFVRTTYTATVVYENNTYTDEKVFEEGNPEHTYSTEWKTDGNKHWHECVCGAKSDVAEHVYENEKVDKLPTCVEAGQTISTCVCGDKMATIIPATGEHTYENGICTGCGAEFVDTYYVNLLNSYKNMNGFSVKLKDFSFEIKEKNSSLAEAFELIGSVKQLDVTELALYLEDGKLGGAATGSIGIFNGPISGALAVYEFKAIIYNDYVYINVMQGKDKADKPMSIKMSVDALFGQMTTEVFDDETAARLTADFFKDTVVPTIETLIELNADDLDVIMENAFNMIFTFEKQAGGTVVATLDYAKVRALNENLATKPVAEVVDIYFGEGAFNKTSDWLLNIFNLKLSEIPAYIDEQGLDADELIDKLDAFMEAAGAPEEYNIRDILTNEEFADITVGMLVFGTEDNSYVENYNETLSILREKTLYELIEPEHAADIKAAVDEVIDMLAGKVALSFTTDASGMLISVSLGADGFVASDGSDEEVTVSGKIEVVVNGRIDVDWSGIIDSIDGGIVMPEDDMLSEGYTANYSYGYGGYVNYKGEEYYYENGVRIYVNKADYDDLSYAIYQPDCQGWTAYELCYAGIQYRFDIITIRVDGYTVNLLKDVYTGETVELVQTETGFTAVYEDGSTKDVVFDLSSGMEDPAMAYAKLYFDVYENTEGRYTVESDYVYYYYNASLGQYADESHHELEYKYEPIGGYCYEDGCYETVTCKNCDFFVSNKHYGCIPEYGVEIDLTEYGACGGSMNIDRCKACGRTTSVNYINIGCSELKASEEDILNDKGEIIGIRTINKCDKCSFKRVYEDKTYAVADCIYERYESTRMYVGDVCISNQTYSHKFSDHRYNDTYEFLGNSCEDGYYVNRVCEVCGDSDRYMQNGHIITWEHINLDGYEMCGGWGEKSYCRICNKVDNFHISDHCIWQPMGTNSDGYEVYRCAECGAIKHSLVNRSEKDENCRYSITESYIYFVRGEEILRFDASYEGEDHHFFYTFDLMGSSCEDGVRVIQTCKDCDIYHETTNYYHETFEKNRVDLTEYGACYGEFVYSACPCGYRQDIYDNSCTDHGSENKYYDEDGKLIYVFTSGCSKCGLRHDRSYYIEKNQDSCTKTYYNTVVISMNGSLIFETEYQRNEEAHDYKVEANLMNGTNSSCENGVYIVYTCKDCDRRYTEEYYHHRTFEKERIELSELGNVCGGYVTLDGCACGEYTRLNRDGMLCDLGYEHCNLWIPDALTDGQYTIDGWGGIYYDARLYICAVTDPVERACGYKIRYASYFKKEANACLAYQYETWQFGYNEETDTCEYELTFKTGTYRLYHDYVMTRVDEPYYSHDHYDCPDCGSYYYINRYYVDRNGYTELLKYEEIGVNAFGGGFDRSYKRIEEYSWNSDGNRYMSRDRSERVYADGSSWWRENLNEEKAYVGSFGTDGREVVSIYSNSEGDGYTNRYAYVYYKGYRYEIFRHTIEGDYWQKSNFEYTFGNGCTVTETYTDSTGNSWSETRDCCYLHRIHVVKPATCSQDGIEYRECDVCGYCTEEYEVLALDHSWIDMGKDWYYCSRCGLENDNGVSGAIIMEDLTDKYGNGEYYVVGYFAQNNVAFSKYISLILANKEEVAIFDGIEFIEIDGIRAFAFRKADVEAWATANGYTDYDVRFSFVPDGADGSFDYGITFTDNLDMDYIIDSVSFEDHMGFDGAKYEIRPTETRVWTFNVTSDQVYLSATLYNSNGKEIKMGYAGETISYRLRAGETYYLQVESLDGSVGIIYVIIEQLEK